MEKIIIFVLLGVIIIDKVVEFFEHKHKQRIIHELTDKIMSRNWGDYIVGRETEKVEKLPEVETRRRDDTHEWLIEQAEKGQQKLEALEKKFKDILKKP